MWFNDECKEVTKNGEKAQRKLSTHPTAASVEKYRIIRTKARRTTKTYAISLALAVICHNKEKNFTIFSDSMSSFKWI